MSQFKDDIVASEICYFWFSANLTTGSAGDGASPLYDVRLAGAASNAAPTASGTPTLLSHADYTDGLHEIAIDTTGYANGEYAVFCTLTISTVNPAGFVGSFRVRTANRIDGLVTEMAKIPKSDSTVTWNATALGSIQTQAEDALVVHRLDELLNADSDIDGAAPPTVGSVFHELMTKTAGSFTYDQTTDSLEANRDNVGTAGAGLTAADDAVVVLLGSPAASVSADIAAVKVDTAAILVDTGTTLDGRIPAALTANGNMKCSLVEILTTALTETAGLLAGGFKKFFNVGTPTGTVNSLPDAVAGAASGVAIVGSAMTLTSAYDPAKTAAQPGADGDTLKTLSDQLDGIHSKTTNLPSDPADESLIIAATDALSTLIGDVPTNSEFAAALGTADDAVLAQVALVKAVTDQLIQSAKTIVEGVCAALGTTTLVIASSTTPASGVNDQFNGRVMIFAEDTITVALRGQATSITDYVHATKTFTVVALTTAPALNDVFVIL